MLSANWSMTAELDGASFARALFFGFAAAMLGISGFESSANFIEEQKPGVFPKTLRNMWLAVTVFNPLISLLSLGVLPLLVIQSGGAGGGPPEDLLARMGNVAFHRLMGHDDLDGSDATWLGMLVSVDAVLVLSGAVLTSFVGVTGLVRRMTLDRCLPQVLLRENSWRHTNHWILLSFFAVCCGILFSTGGDVGVLAGVYTISFLGVMALFAIGNILLKIKRRSLPRETKAGWSTVVVALLAVLLGLVGNVIKDPAGVRIFALYLAVFAFVVQVMFMRVQILKAVLFVSRALIERVVSLSSWIATGVRANIDSINSRTVVYFAKDDDPALLNRAALYVLENEQTNRMKVVHVYEDAAHIPAELAKHLMAIDRLYPRLRIDFVAVKGTFGPELIELLSQRLNVPKNYMLIGTPGDRFPHRVEALGGVRLIM